MEAVPEMLQNRRSDQIASKEEEKKTRTEETNQKVDENIKESGQISLQESGYDHKIHLLSVIGEIEGHECLSANTKTTKYEHVLPRLAEIEDSREVDGVIVLLNTVGGDVESGLAIAEMIASLSKPTVSLVLGGSHSIGVPACCFHQLFLYRAHGNDGDSSGADERYGDRRARHLRLLQADAG